MQKPYYDNGSGVLSKNVIEQALTRLADLLKEHNKNVELVAAGGVISVMVFGSREMTRDIDVIIPESDRNYIISLVDKVAKELNLPTGKHAWLNDGVAFFGLQTKGDTIIFEHTHLMVYTASWYELLGMKLSGAWRRDSDFHDAIHILRMIGENDKHKTLEQSKEFRNFTPHIDDETFTKRFERTWLDAFS